LLRLGSKREQGANEKGEVFHGVFLYPTTMTRRRKAVAGGTVAGGPTMNPAGGGIFVWSVLFNATRQAKFVWPVMAGNR
jgi:hypothetical protein